MAVTGATGLVGRALLPALVARGHRVVGLTRGAPRPPSAGTRWATYDPLDASTIAAALEGADAVVHLAGENLFAARWRAAFLARIRESRVDATRALVEAIGRLSRRPSVLVSASAIGWYGPRPPEEALEEGAAPGDDFLARVCRDWEAEAQRAEAHGLRVATGRNGVVLARGGGALAQMLRPFRWFVGGPIGRGTQVMSWVHLDDVRGLFVRAVEDASWRGPFNVVSPNPVSNREFATALGRAIHRPSFLPTPAFALRVLLGRVAEVVASGQRVVPAVARARGYEFRFPRLEAALADLLAEAEPAARA